MSNKLLNGEGKGNFGRYPALDGVRGIAVLLVVVAHFALLFPASHISGGLLGVDVFFVLSGFLITSILIKEFDTGGEISLRNFYARRFLRLMPAYWTLLMLIYLFAYQILPPIQAALVRGDNTLLSCLLYYSNRSRMAGQSLGVLTHTWSLSIEEQFYFMWAPLLYLMLALLKHRHLILLATATINILLVVILERRIQQGVLTTYLYNAIECRLFAIMIGSLIAMVVAWRVLSPRFLASRAHSCLASVAFCAVLGLGLAFK